MRIITPSFEILELNSQDDGIRLLRKVEQMARISHRSEEQQTNDSWSRFLSCVVRDRGDYSVIEHAGITVVFRVDRGVMFELTRHRLFSFTAESTRFCNYKKKGEIEIIKPADLPESEVEKWRDSISHACATYNSLIEKGVRPQEARSVLPNALAATIAVTGNLRSWRHLFIMRTTRETHPDFRRVTIPLLNEFKRIVPLLYDDVEPNARQIDNLQKAR